MGKKKSRAKYVSKGSGRAVSQRWCRDDRSFLDRQVDKFEAFKRGKRVYFTVPNPDPNQTSKRFIRVEGKQLFGDFRKYR